MTLEDQQPAPVDPSIGDAGLRDPGPGELGGTEADRAAERADMAGVIGSPWAGMARLAVLVGLVVVLGVTRGIPIVVVILAILLMIFLHELGHYLAARWSGMKATEFFIGFGPRIWSFRRGETEFGIKAIPAGAYVKILGMSNLEEVDPADEARTYRQAPFRSRFNVAIAGSAMHFAVALLLLVVQFMFIGAPDGDRWEVGQVTPGSAAAAAGLQEGDRITSFDGVPVQEFDEFRSTIAAAEPGQIDLVVDRDGTERTLAVDLSRRTKIIGTVGEDLDLLDNGSGIVVGSVNGAGLLENADSVVTDAGLAEGELVTQVNGRPVTTLEEVAAAVKGSSDGQVEITTERNGVTEQHTVDLGSAVATTAPAAFLGVGKTSLLATDSLPGAVGSSFSQFGETVGVSVAGVATFLWPPNIVDFVTSTATGSEAPDPASTPTPAEQTSTASSERPISIVGAVLYGSDLTAESWSNLIGFLIALNIFIGVFNLIPLLPFDGGHVAIAVYEKAQEMRRRSRQRYMADVSRMLPVAYGVVMVLVVVGLLAMYLDVTKGVGT